MYATARATTFGDSIFEFDVYGLTNTPPLTGGNGNGGNGICPWVGSTAPVATRVQQVLNTMDQAGGGQPAVRRRHLVLHRPGQRHPQSVHPVDQHGGRPVRSR